MEIKKISNIIPVLIELEEFDEAPGPNCMSFGFNIQKLINSIKAVGLINLPFVTRNREGRLDIVTGYRRIMALKAMKCDRIHCMDLSDSGLSKLEMFLFNLYDNITIRKFNEVEKGMILKGLILHISKENVAKEYMQMLGIRNLREFEILMRINELDETAKKSIATGTISINTLGLIHGLDKGSSAIILRWISDLKFNFNQQLKYIDYLIDISIKEDKSIADIMDEYQFLGLLKEKDLNTPQKARAIINLLRNRRFPFLTESEKEFNKKIKGLMLQDGVIIRHPPYFEGEDYRLEIVFKNGRELKEKIDTLAKIEGLHNIKDPWRGDS